MTILRACDEIMHSGPATFTIACRAQQQRGLVYYVWVCKSAISVNRKYVHGVALCEPPQYFGTCASCELRFAYTGNLSRISMPERTSRGIHIRVCLLSAGQYQCRSTGCTYDLRTFRIQLVVCPSTPQVMLARSVDDHGARYRRAAAPMPRRAKPPAQVQARPRSKAAQRAARR